MTEILTHPLELLARAFGFPVQSDGWTERSVNREEPLEENSKPWINRFFEAYVRDSDRVLEVGSGTGYLERQLKPEHQGRVRQSDSSPSMIEANQRDDPNSNVVDADMTGLPFEKSSYDIVIDVNALDTLNGAELEKAIGEAGRVLKPQGRFIHLMDLPPYKSKASKEVFNKGLANHLEGVGWKILEVYEDRPYHLFSALVAEAPSR